MKVLVLHGPNLNLLGERKPEIYGKTTLAEINRELKRIFREAGIQAVAFQSNHEGELIDRVHALRKKISAILINPAAYTHTSIALRDALEAVDLPVVEVHLTDIQKREGFRRRSLIRGIALRQFSGKGARSYYDGAQFLIRLLRSRG